MEERLRRIYQAISDAEEEDMSKLPGEVYSGDVVGVSQDFSAGVSEETFANLAHAMIHNISNLADHLRRWAKKNGKDKTRVDEALKASFELRVLLDLSNNDKHGYPPRDGGHSGRLPRLLNPRRILRLTTGAVKGSGVSMTLGKAGEPVIRGSGSAKAIVTGEIVDGDGEAIGGLYDIVEKAVADWEVLLLEYGVQQGDARS